MELVIVSITNSAILIKMTSSFNITLFIIFVFSAFLSHSSSYIAKAKATPLILPIKKDGPSGLYYTQIQAGTPPYSVKLLVDIATQWTWFNCNNTYNSKAYTPVSCDSPTCDTLGGNGCSGCDGPARPGCTNNTCGVSPYNPFANLQFSEGLGLDVLILHSTDGINYTSRIHVPAAPISCTGSYALEGFPNVTQGVMALSRSTASLPTTLFSKLKLTKKLAICLPSSSKLGHGDIYIGGGPYYRPFTKQDFSKTLLVTQLLINPNSTAPIYTVGDASFEYFVDVRAVKVGYELVSFKSSLLDFDKDGVGGSKISTITPYTKLHSSIFKPFVRAFNKAASDKKIAKAVAVAPFGTCFETKTIGSTKAGLDVPIITLVLRSDVHWEIHGSNSMVRVSKDVVCLAFVDGGKEPRTSIVIGGHQMEENLIEIDVGSSTFGFSNSLLLQNTSCSHF